MGSRRGQGLTEPSRDLLEATERLTYAQQVTAGRSPESHSEGLPPGTYRLESRHFIGSGLRPSMVGIDPLRAGVTERR
jgi:hypothetical protein